MSKITFRADDDLVEAVEELDASKSEIMREALRSYLGLDEPGRPGPIGRGSIDESLEDVIARRVDARLDERLGEGRASDREVTVHIDLDGAHDAHEYTKGRGRTSDEHPRADHQRETTHSCPQCGIELQASYSFCPNCGGRTTPTFYCECGRELDTEWAFCPDCGRRVASLDVPEP